jgi:hypothetical protein
LCIVFESFSDKNDPFIAFHLMLFGTVFLGKRLIDALFLRLKSRLLFPYTLLYIRAMAQK